MSSNFEKKTESHAYILKGLHKISFRMCVVNSKQNDNSGSLEFKLEKRFLGRLHSKRQKQ